MDFERASIKALFYDYPVEAVVKAIEQGHRFKDDFLDILPQLVRWREDAFTTTEARLMENLAQDIWMRLDEQNAAQGYVDGPQAVNIPFIYRPFLLVKHIAKDLLDLDMSNRRPLVQFEKLLRWKDTTLFVGEDLLTTAFMAYNDVTASPQHQTEVFDWPDYLSHNDNMLNEVLSRGVEDLHAHYNASADVFGLNWINLTNSLTQLDERIKKKVKVNQDVTLSTSDTEQMYSFKRMCIAAAYLRLQFFKLLNWNECEDLRCVKSILEDDIYAGQMRSEICAEISVLRSTALKGTKHRALDYAIQPDTEVLKNINNANIIFHGERNLMYQFFYRFFAFDSKIWSLAPCFYLYIILKTRIRKEFVQINQLKGFENFETYQDRKDMFMENDPICELFDPIVLQTTIRNYKDHLEGRITPSELGRMKDNSRLHSRNYKRGVFVEQVAGCYPKSQISLVVHFIKANYSKSEKAHDLYLSNRQDYPRYDKYRADLKKWINQVLKVYEQQMNRPDNIKIVGIDAASTEMFCRPEVFGHIFRYARVKGLTNQTYHVGEDFFDIIDGLRAIDEAMLFLGLDSHCRIGHGLAMGIEPEKYYIGRRFNIIAPKQYVLDNCVWICMTASAHNIDIPNSLETDLKKLAEQLYREIGYDRCLKFNMYSYWNSMLLRGDEPCSSGGRMPAKSYWAKTMETEWQQTAEVNEPSVNIARQDKDACLLYYLYNYCHAIKSNGEVRYQGKYSNEIIEVVKQLQEQMRRKVAAKQIAIECNPTSNLKIGFIDNYCEHPLLQKFDPIEKQSDPHYPLLNASVNTDDRGVFATTLYNEFSLLALGMMKEKNDDGTQKYCPRQVVEYIEHLRQAGEKQRFRVD